MIECGIKLQHLEDLEVKQLELSLSIALRTELERQWQGIRIP